MKHTTIKFITMYRIFEVSYIRYLPILLPHPKWWAFSLKLNAIHIKVTMHQVHTCNCISYFKINQIDFAWDFALYEDQSYWFHPEKYTHLICRIYHIFSFWFSLKHFTIRFVFYFNVLTCLTNFIFFFILSHRIIKKKVQMKQIFFQCL